MPFITSIQCPIKAVTINQSILGPPSPLDPPSTPTPTPSCRSHGSALRPQAPTPGLPRWTRHQHRRTIKQAGSSASCGSSRLYPAAAATVPGPGCSMSGRQRGAEALRGMPVGGGWQASEVEAVAAVAAAALTRARCSTALRQPGGRKRPYLGGGGEGFGGLSFLSLMLGPRL